MYPVIFDHITLMNVCARFLVVCSAEICMTDSVVCTKPQAVMVAEIYGLGTVRQ